MPGQSRSIALLREVSDGLARCELTHRERRPIDVAAARREHAEYARLLAALGCEVRALPGEERFPDCVFIEDTAVVLPEVAVVTRPGAASRRGETAAVAAALREFRPVVEVAAPATLDGGDVLRLSRRLHVGLSGRSSAEGVEQLRRHLEPHGYEVVEVAIDGCLHLKSAVTQVGEDLLLANPDWVDLTAFAGWRMLEVDPAEPDAANALLVGDRVVFPAAYPRTRRRLERAGVAVAPVAAAELAKAEGGVTCCSLVFEI